MGIFVATRGSSNDLEVFLNVNLGPTPALRAANPIFLFSRQPYPTTLHVRGDVEPYPLALNGLGDDAAHLCDRAVRLAAQDVSQARQLRYACVLGDLAPTNAKP
jgi:hypothetical protein